jgi:hypothetical protein
LTIILGMTRQLAVVLFLFGGVGTVLSGVSPINPGASTVAARPSEETIEALRAIRAVGPEGYGNVNASVAWKKLAQGDAGTLIHILAAMDGANDLALNWLRAAVDSNSGRVLSSGGSLPLADLGLFLQDTRHSPNARRLVFELLARNDAPTADKLLAGMLNDPSLEIRYDAVQKVIEQARQSLVSSNKAGATLLFQQALSCARDVGQIKDISTNLVELGQVVDSLKLFGFQTQWKIIGPFDNAERKGLEIVYPPEQKIDTASEYDGKAGKAKWQDYVVTDEYGKVDLNQAYGKLKSVLAYATTDFLSDHVQSAELRLGCETSWKVWLNGKLLFSRDEYHYDSQIDQYKMPVQFQAGHNIILVKVCQNEQTEDWTVDWNLQLRVTDSLGAPIVSAAPANTASSTSELR